MLDAEDALVRVVIHPSGQVDMHCRIAKTEAVKLLLNVVEELRFQAYREADRLIEVPQVRLPAAPRQ